MVNIKQLESDINFLKEYYKELNELKSIGIDLTRMDAHNRLVKFVMEELFETYGVDKSVEIMRYAEMPIISFDEFVNNLYPPKVEAPKIKEVSKNSESKTEFTDKPVKDDIVFHINGRPVSRSEYEDARKIFEDIFSKFF